jgi:hypothetical protein
MSTTFKAVVESYLCAKTLSRGTRNEYRSTVRKWEQWGGGPPIEALQHKEIREFLDWVHEHAIAEAGTNPGRTANKAREHLRAVLSWAWEQELIEAPPRFPGPREQRDAAGRHYLTKAEINALYFATHQMKRPRGWDSPFPVGRYWRAALVVFFNYGVDTGTVWKSAPFHEPILWGHVTWEPQSPDRELKERSRWGWLFYRRVKTGKSFYRPLNHVAHAHLKSILPESVSPDEPVFLGGGRARPVAAVEAEAGDAHHGELDRQHVPFLPGWEVRRRAMDRAHGRVGERRGVEVCHFLRAAVVPEADRVLRLLCHFTPPL